MKGTNNTKNGRTPIKITMIRYLIKWCITKIPLFDCTDINWKMCLERNRL